MEMMRGNTYRVAVRVRDCAGRVVGGDGVAEVQFVLGGAEKFYRADGSGEAEWDAENGVYLVELSEEETFAMKGVVKWQVRVKFDGGEIKGSRAKSEYVYDCITETRLGD